VLSSEVDAEGVDVVSITVRFPDGSREFRYPERALEEGDTVWHAGQRYRVVSVQTEGDVSTVVVESDSGELADDLRSEEGGVRLEPLD
jgi:hypothetical protein